MKTTALRAPLILAALLAFAPLAQAQDLDFKKQIEQGRYSDLADKLEGYLDLGKADAKLRAYLQMNIDYLRRGAKPRVPGSEVILVRGAKNDRLYQMPNAQGRKRRDGHSQMWTDSYPSGGPRLMLPNRIRHLRSAWDKRLPYFDRYFEEATDLLGGNGAQVRELDKIIGHHKGGGLGTSANSVKSVLISTSTRPLSNFGPPYYIIKVAPERCIFNYEGLSNEFEVLLPFWILPHEIVARCDSLQEVLDHPLYKQSQLKDIPFRSGSWNEPSNWDKLERNVREGRLPLPLDAPADGSLTGTLEYRMGDLFFNTGGEGLQVRPAAVARELSRFTGEGIKVRLKGAVAAGAIVVEEIVSPTFESDLSATADAEGKLTDASGHALAVYGPFAKAPFQDTVRFEGYLFTDAAGTPVGVYPRRVQATLSEELVLRRPFGNTYPVGTPVEISYVTSTGNSAIVRSADGGWGYVKTKKLSIGGPASGVGLSGAVNGATGQ